MSMLGDKILTHGRRETLIRLVFYLSIRLGIVVAFGTLVYSYLSARAAFLQCALDGVLLQKAALLTAHTTQLVFESVAEDGFLDYCSCQSPKSWFSARETAQQAAACAQGGEEDGPDPITVSGSAPIAVSGSAVTLSFISGEDGWDEDWWELERDFSSMITTTGEGLEKKK